MEKKMSPYVVPGLKRRHKEISYEDFVKLLNLVATRYEVSSDEILAKDRTAPLPYIRMLIIYYVRKVYSLTSTTEISRFLRRENHTAAIHGTKIFQNKLDTDERIDKKLKSEYATVREDYLHTSKYLNSCL